MQHGQAAQPPGKRRLFRRWNDEDLLPYRIEKEFKAPTLENQQNLKTHGRVVLAKDASNDMVVIKIFEKSNNGLRNQPKYLDSFRKEMKFQALAAKGSHPAVPTIFKTIETKETLAFVMDWMQGGDLIDMLMKRSKIRKRGMRFEPVLNDMELRHIFYPLASLLFHIHEELPPEKQFAHRDFKLDNIGLKANKKDLDVQGDGKLKGDADLLDTQVFLLDFGLAQFRRPVSVEVSTLLNKRCGTLEFVAPEIHMSRTPITDIAPLDVWSFGISLLASIVGRLPKIEAKWLIVDDPPMPSAMEQQKFNVSPSVWDLLEKIFQEDPSKRLTIRGVLEHPYFNDCDNDAAYRPGSTSQQLCVQGRQRLANTEPVKPVTSEEVQQLFAEAVEQASKHDSSEKSVSSSSELSEVQPDSLSKGKEAADNQ